MSLDKVFCSSPWFHYIIEQNGQYRLCCWSNNGVLGDYYLHSHTEQEFMNSQAMRSVRTSMLAGEPIKHCQSCYRTEELGQVSGRMRQLDKSIIKIENLSKTIKQSPHLDNFTYSLEHQGSANTNVGFIKVNLGNTCNGACLYCFPKYSEKLNQEFKKLNFYSKDSLLKYQEPPQGFFHDDPTVWERFVNSIIDNPHLQFLQLLGGETLYEKRFYDLLDRLILSGRSKTLQLGLTTNGTIWDASLEEKFQQFLRVDIGISIDADHPVNDYVRYPSKIETVRENIKKIASCRSDKFYVLLRPTQTLFSIYHYDTLIQLSLDLKLAQETSFVLLDPNWMKVEMLPRELRDNIYNRLDKIRRDYHLTDTVESINMRDQDKYLISVSNHLHAYMNLLKEEPVITQQQKDQLVFFLHKLEANRNNSILDYLPDYEQFLRSIGY